MEGSPLRAGRSGRAPGRHGFTLTELLVAAALSLVVMGAVASLFGVFGRSVRQSQATVQLSSLLRSASWQLRQDLTGVTCPLEPWLSPETNSGYFELIEGPARDATRALDAQGEPTDDLSADTDDILLFTTQSLAGPFVGRYGGGMIESPYAEVAWFCRPAASQPVAGTTLYDLHRRQLLVINYLGRADLVNNALATSIDRAAYDLSLRTATIEGQGQVLLPNSLGDLTKRENRFMRSGYSFLTEAGAVRSVAAGTFPFAFPVDGTGYAVPEAALDAARRAWEDVVLTNVIAFDVRVFDPRAAVPDAADAQGRLPGDPGYTPPAAAQAGDGSGAYVDLGWRGGTPVVRTAGFPPSGQTALASAGLYVTDVPRKAALPAACYDTWSRAFEFNGIDDDADGVVDEGLSGIDTNGDGWPESTGAAETSPPYPVPLRGLEVRLRCYEPVSKQIRQITIRHSFMR